MQRYHRNSPRGVRSTWLIAAGVAVFALALTGCAGSEGDDAAAGDADTADDTATTSGDDPGATAEAPSGDPIKLGSVLTINNPAWSNQSVADVNDVWAEYVNTELGGINGRPLEIISCDDEGDPGLTVRCTEDLIDEGVVAFVNNSSLAFGTNALPTMEAAGIPNIGGWPIFPPEYESEFNFPTAPGASGSYPSLAAYFSLQTGGTLGIVYTDTAGGQGVADQLTALWPELGGDDVVSVAFDPNTPDFAPVLTRLADGDPDAVILAVGEGPAPRMIQAADVVGLLDSAAVGMTSTAATGAVLSNVGDLAEGLIFSLATVPPDLSGDEDVAHLHEVMGVYGPDVELTPQAAVAAASVQYAVDVLMSVDGEIDSTSIIETLESLEVEPFLTHSMSPDLAPEGLPRVWNPYNLIAEYRDGDLQPVGDDLEGQLISNERGMTWFTGFTSVGEG